MYSRVFRRYVMLRMNYLHRDSHAKKTFSRNLKISFNRTDITYSSFCLVYAQIFRTTPNTNKKKSFLTPKTTHPYTQLTYCSTLALQYVLHVKRAMHKIIIKDKQKEPQNCFMLTNLAFEGAFSSMKIQSGQRMHRLS